MSDPSPAVPSLRPIAMGDERLIDALKRPGCPLCRYVERTGGEYLGSLLYDQVTVVDVRRRFDEGGGFCVRHVRATRTLEYRHSGGLTGTAILLRSMLAARRAALERALTARRPSGDEVRAAAAIGRGCIVCAQESSAETDVLDRLVSHADRDALWREVVERAPWCLSHVAALGARFVAARDDPGRQAFTRAQMERLASLDAQVERFVHDSAADRRHLLDEGDRAAVARTEEFLGGGTRA